MSRLRALLAVVVVAGVAAAGVHDAARADGLSRKQARHASITEGLDCSACHTTRGWRALSDDFGGAASASAGGGFDHARTGFPLSGRHQHVACTGCHQGQERVTRECSGCHADVHERRLGQGCDECHDARSFRDVQAIALHARTRLPLTGMHVLADCTECHRATGPRQWSSAPADCFACHADVYRRSDVHPRHTGGMGDPPSSPLSHACGECHRATGWAPAIIPVNAFDSALSVSAGGLRLDPQRHELSFPIAHGSHRGASCDDCHGGQRVAQAVRCTGCHAHTPPRLQSAHRPLGKSPRDGACMHCHAGGAVR